MAGHLSLPFDFAAARPNEHKPFANRKPWRRVDGGYRHTDKYQTHELEEARGRNSTWN